MKTVVAISFVAFQLLLGCKNTAVAVGEDMPLGHQDVVKEREDQPKKPEQQQSISLEELIGNKKYAILVHSDSIEISNIKSVLIEGTNDEYGRKLELVKEIKLSGGDLLKAILNNKNYIEVEGDNRFTFNPTVQFQMTYEDEQLLLLFDEKTGSLGFTSIEGQTILKIAEPLKQELLVISNN